MAKVITGKVRFSYAHVFEPSAAEEGQDKKYSVSLLIPKDDTETIEKIEAAVKEATAEGKAKFGGKIPIKLKLPLRDGDEEREDDENYKGMMFVNATSKNKPGIVDEELKKIVQDPDSVGADMEDVSKEQFYSGCFGRASVNFYAFNVAGNKGVACGLNNLQKMEDGDRLSGGPSAEDDFGDDLM